MGIYQFRLPDVGEGTAEAEIVAWHVKVGDVVHEDQNLVDVMTDKATVEMPVPIGGKVLALHGEPGDMAAVGAVLVEIEVEGEGNAKAVKPAAAPAAAKAPEPKPAPVAKIEAPAPKPVAARQPAAPFRPKAGAKPLASPAVRARADELGIKLQYVPGSGPAGRITQADLDAYAHGYGAVGGGAMSAYAAREGADEVKVIGLRRRIAEKMQESKRRIPHYAYIDEVDMTELESLRTYLNSTKKADQPKLNVLPFLMRALVKVLPEFPEINARFDDEAGVVHRHHAVHIGIATQTDNGLIVPVVKHAEARDIWDCAREVARVATAARENKAAKDELSGSTITITSLGALGGLATTPVINYPEVAIIGPNAIIDRPVVRDGQIVVRKMMNLSSSFDHRVVDGFDAAQFIQRIKGLLEHPAAIFVD
ncbi:MAG: 2-oxo acid dehydrogenase subunit E2 [Alphaproteobacteria bacterium]|nr:2-oxo acid dehydrogenase subunit E2 [Alphaproteobacteria bacterium]MBL7097729.1 2-oxo acid dehydrogenase subunit E2 [Alphaproteobacteria bacterium]